MPSTPPPRPPPPQVGVGQRELVGRLDLKRRNYIGTTSLDAELSLVMANLDLMNELTSELTH